MVVEAVPSFRLIVTTAWTVVVMVAACTWKVAPLSPASTVTLVGKLENAPGFVVEMATAVLPAAIPSSVTVQLEACPGPSVVGLAERLRGLIIEVNWSARPLVLLPAGRLDVAGRNGAWTLDRIAGLNARVGVDEATARNDISTARADREIETFIAILCANANGTRWGTPAQPKWPGATHRGHDKA
jgi:hypothetical protein